MLAAAFGGGPIINQGVVSAGRVYDYIRAERRNIDDGRPSLCLDL